MQAETETTQVKKPNQEKPISHVARLLESGMRVYKRKMTTHPTKEEKNELATFKQIKFKPACPTCHTSETANRQKK